MATDTLQLKVSQSVYGVPAQFSVFVDGKQVGTTYQATSAHGWKSDSVTLTGDWDKGDHSVQLKFLNDFKDAGGDRNLYLDGAVYDGVPVPGAVLNMWSAYDPNTFKLTDTTALPASATPSTPTTTAPSTPTTTTPTADPTDTLVLKVSQSAYGAAAQFSVFVDGVQVGGTYQATSIHGWKSDSVTLKGNWDSGDHSVDIRFLNDFKDAGGDRNLYLDGATYNGVAVPNAKLDMWSAYDAHVFKISDTTPLTTATTPPPATTTPPPTTTTPTTGTGTTTPTDTTTPTTGTGTTTPTTGTGTTTPTTGTDSSTPPTTTTPTTGTAPATTDGPDHLTLRMSEQSYKSIHAQFTVTVDGKQVGGTYTTTASHADKASDSIDISGDWAPGTHQVNIHFANDEYGGWSGADRNLYLDGAKYNGTEIMGVAKAITGGATNSDANFSFTEAGATTTTPVTTTPGTTVNHDGLTDLNVLIRGQSNAQLFDQYGGDDALKAELQKALPGVNINIIDGDGKTEFSATAFTTWDTDGQQQKMTDYLKSLPAETRDNETITVWMHNEYDQKIDGLTTAQWKQEVQTDAAAVRDIFDHQTAASTPYLFVPIRYPYGGSFPAIRQGMEELSADPAFNAKISWAAYGSNITMAGGPETGSNGSHMTSADAAVIGRDMATPVLDLYHAIA